MSPILDLQRRLREIGRLRIGEQVAATNRDGSPTTRPSKLSTFRFTSRDEQVIRQAAELFGGEATPWEDAPGQAQWQVTTEAKSLDVMIPPGEMAFSQWYELWSKGGCQRRCDGATEVIADKACVCDPKDRECDPHTRLSVMLPSLPGLGLWRLDTQGWNAAKELAGAVELCSAATAGGVILPARLRLEIREEKKPGEKVRKFAVPVLDLDVAAGTLGALPSASFTPVPELPPGPQPSIAEQLASVGEEGPGRNRSNAAEPIQPTGLRPRAADGEPLAPVSVRVALIARVLSIPAPQFKACADAWHARFGEPRALLERDVDAATELVTEYEVKKPDAEPAPQPGAGDDADGAEAAASSEQAPAPSESRPPADSGAGAAPTDGTEPM